MQLRTIRNFEAECISTLSMKQTENVYKLSQADYVDIYR